MASLGNPDFDLYRPSDDHDALREAIRALATDKIAPRAAEIDETHEFHSDNFNAARPVIRPADLGADLARKRVAWRRCADRAVAQ